MNVIQLGTKFNIQGSGLKVHQRLPAQAYEVIFIERQGFSLVEKENLFTINEKVYGVQREKVDKVLNSFALFERNLGVILSGDKGIGKSLFSKRLGLAAIEKGLPLIIVNDYVPGIADFISSINQEVMVLFDEFDKTFFNSNRRNECGDPQTEMLTLFDGLDSGKKLFVITCNSLTRLNDFLVNRPGRFHYHFRFEYPTPEEVEEYLKDKIPVECYVEIPKVVQFSQKVALNYDCLRAIAFELSLGLSFEQLIKDLNILNMKQEEYKIIVEYASGYIAQRVSSFDMFDFEEKRIRLDYQNYQAGFYFNPKDAFWSAADQALIVPGDKVKADWRDDWYDDEEDKDALTERKKDNIIKVTFKRTVDKDIHYTT